MAKLSRDKGKRGELEVAELLRSFGHEARRGQQYAGGGDSPDVVHSMKGHHIEVKRVETFSLYPALGQADEDRHPEEVPLIFHRRNGKEWVVVMYAVDFLKMENKNASD